MKYTVKCKELFLKNIRPSNALNNQKSEYAEIMNIADMEIKTIGIDNFSSHFQEMQYLVNLWTAHILFEKKDVSSEIKEECLSIIRDYSTTPFDIDLAKEEENWLKERGLN